MYFQGGGDWIPLDIQYFFGGGVCGCPGVFLRICAAIRYFQAFDFWYAFIWVVMDKQAAPTERLPNGNVTKAI